MFKFLSSQALLLCLAITKVIGSSSAKIYNLSADELKRDLDRSPLQILTARPDQLNSQLDTPAVDDDFDAGPFDFRPRPSYGSTIADCAAHDGLCELNNFGYRFTLYESVCAGLHSPRRYSVTCNSYFRKPPTRNVEITGYRATFLHDCPEHFVCQDVHLQTTRGIRFDTKCVPDDIVHLIEVHSGIAIPENPTTGLHCSHDQQVPGPSYRAYGGLRDMDLILTTEVFWPNGSAYKAPELLIRDKSIAFPYSNTRTQKIDTSVLSTTMSVGVIRGRIQQSTIQFCMRLPKARRDFWVLFMYSWFKAPRFRSQIPAPSAMQQTLEPTKGEVQTASAIREI